MNFETITSAGVLAILIAGIAPLFLHNRKKWIRRLVPATLVIAGIAALVIAVYT